MPTPGDTVIMRAYTFTNYAGRFLYVEAHNKAHTNNTGPVDGGLLRGSRRRLQQQLSISRTATTRTAATSSPTPAQYMYHRELIALRGAYANSRRRI